MKSHFTICLVAGVLNLAGISDGLGWGQNGHRVTAELAERHLNEKSRVELRKILGRESLAEISTWADEIRSNPEWDFVEPWHYVSIEDDQKWEEVLEAEAKDEAVNSILEIIPLLEKFLADPKAESMTLHGGVRKRGSGAGLPAELTKEIGKREALALYVHFVGDLHQPLHVGRADDAGGNRIGVEWFGEEVSLHKVWDELMIDSLKLSYTEFASFLDRVPAEEEKAWTSASMLDWARESKAVRERVYDFGPQRSGYFLNVKEPPSLSYQYRADHVDLLRERLAKGGLRLAAKLNAIFANYPD
ncbi:MAG: S1/P1 nuclease [Verrucomicrobiae bacterium]|nr:S1/P1 nuclease [Verrucomicrobiae bacterium]